MGIGAHSGWSTPYSRDMRRGPHPYFDCVLMIKWISKHSLPNLLFVLAALVPQERWHSGAEDDYLRWSNISHYLLRQPRLCRRQYKRQWHPHRKPRPRHWEHSQRCSRYQRDQQRVISKKSPCRIFTYKCISQTFISALIVWDILLGEADNTKHIYFDDPVPRAGYCFCGFKTIE